MGMWWGGHGLWGLILAAIVLVIPAWKVVEKAGYPGVWSLLVLVPLVNVLALWLFAFSRWPGAGQSASTAD